MSLSEYARTFAGRWMDRTLPPVKLPQPIPVTPVDAYGIDWTAEPVEVVELEQSSEDGTGTWIPAGLVAVGDQVNVAGRWFMVAAADVVKPDCDRPGSATLHFGGFHMMGCSYTLQVYVRDEIAAIAAEIEGAL